MSVAYVGLAGPQVAHASMITRAAQQVGGSFGTAVVAVVLQSALSSGMQPVSAYRETFWWTIGFTAIAVVVALALPAKAVEGAVVGAGKQ